MTRNKILRILLGAVAVIAVIALIIGISLFVGNRNNIIKEEITLEKAQEMVDGEFDAIINKTSKSARYLRDNTTVTVESLEYGNEKNIILSCTYKTLDVYTVIHENIDYLLNIELDNKVTGTKKNATKIQQEINGKLAPLMEKAGVLEGSLEMSFYQMDNGDIVLYLDDKVVNTVLGGIIDAHREINNTNSITVGDYEIDISNSNSLRRGLIQCIALTNYDSEKPDTSIPVIKAWNGFKNEFHRNFIEEGRWKYLAKGLGVTLSITALALVLGLVIGFIVAIIRCTTAKTGKFKLLDKICGLYLSVMRGTPVMVQLMIIYFVILLPMGVEKFVAAVLCFGINSGAYVAEIVRGGIMAVDAGQMEAGRSLGFNYSATMFYIVVPQAIKAVLPALANEFIALLKETSVAFYIGVADLTMGGLKIRSITYSNFMPLIAIGIIYLVLVLGLSYLVSLLERRLSKSDRG